MPKIPALRLFSLTLALACGLGFAERLSAQNEERFTFETDTTYHEAELLAVLQPVSSPAGSAFAKTLPAYATRLQAAGTLLLRSRELATRTAAADSIAQLFGEALDLPGGRQYPFAEVSTVSQLSDSTGSWRLLTWQLFVNDSTYRYAGYFVPTDSTQATVPLRDVAQAEGLEDDFELTADQWYGCVYYGARAFRLADGRPAWVLFGYDADGYSHRRKVADVLSFDRKGQPRFGSEVFLGAESRPEQLRSRIILEYRTDARVGLNYDPVLGGIVHDRLVTGPPVRPGMPPSRVPDGSYDGFTLDEAAGVWRYREEYFDRVISTEAPRPQPILGGENSYDLFGRPAKKRGKK